MRVRGAAVTAVVGAGATALTAAATRLETPLGWGLYGLVIGGLCGYAATPWIVRDRPLSALALAVLLYVAAVIVYPIVGPLIALESPMGGVPRLDRWPGEVLSMYALTPIGFLSGLTFVPATLLSAAVAGAIIRAGLGGPIVRPGAAPTYGQEVAEPTEPTPPTEPTLPSGAPASATRTRLETIRAAAEPDVISDRTFGRRVAVGFGLIVLVIVAGYAWLASALSNIGY